MRKRWFVVWHQDSPGIAVTVRRWLRPRSPFSRVGEPFVYGAVTTSPRAVDVRKDPPDSSLDWSSL